MNIDIEKVNIRIKIIEEKKLKAIISLDFGDFIVRGFRVMESKYENIKGDKLWLIPPSYQSGYGKYHPLFFMPDKERWKQLEKRIWEEYYQESDHHYKKRFDMDTNWR